MVTKYRCRPPLFGTGPDNEVLPPKLLFLVAQIKKIAAISRA
jgi:hypothetical protein